MSEEDLLRRWSRRKRAAQEPVQSEPSAPTREPRPAEPEAADRQAEDEFDVSSLPPINSITSATDVTAFLRKGVPPELSRAALRRAWIADPAIRDFVGLAENAWDFNDPQAMPGFGPLDCSDEQLSELVGRVVGGVRRIIESVAAETVERSSNRPPEPGEPDADAPTDARTDASDRAPLQPTANDAAAPAATQLREEPVPDQAITPRRRAHGGALPR